MWERFLTHSHFHSVSTYFAYEDKAIIALLLLVKTHYLYVHLIAIVLVGI